MTPARHVENRRVKTMTIESKLFCPVCRQPVSKAGFGWSGKNHRQMWKCARRNGCGRPTAHPLDSTGKPFDAQIIEGIKER